MHRSGRGPTLGADPYYERTTDRRGYANGDKSKRIDNPAGTVDVAFTKTAGHGAGPFFPQSLERGCRSVRALMLAVAEMYVKGVSVCGEARLLYHGRIYRVLSTSSY